MINETIVLLVYYYHPEDGRHKILKHVTDRYCGAYLPFDTYLGGPLQQIFSRVVIYDYMKRRVEVGREAMNKEVLELVRKERPKYVLWVSFYDDIKPSTLSALRREGSKVVGWYFDDEWRFDEYSRYWVPYLDYCVTNAIEAVPKYAELGGRVIQTVPNTGVAVAHDWSQPEKYDVSFVGTRSYGDRDKWIGELQRRNIPVRRFGLGFEGGYVTFEDMLDIFASSKINLNFSRAGMHPVRQIKGRVFQACMAGGFVLTEYTPGLEKYFEIGKEIVCFNSPEEMADKIVYYLGHDEERRAIARAGWQKATSRYTSTHMVADVFARAEQDTAPAPAGNSTVASQPDWSKFTRAMLSNYNFQWGRALLEERERDGRWKEDLKASLAYRPWNPLARYYYIAGHLPSPLQPPLFWLCRTGERAYWGGLIRGANAKQKLVKALTGKGKE
ncbi:MAG: glycosyltransferase [Dehalococcoidales bacterium]|nr:glycosyltransferase [Dehalococcoidales bacterium]